MSTTFIIESLRPEINETQITVIQEDQSQPGSFIVTTPTAIYRISAGAEPQMTRVAGHDRLTGYYESNDGKKARFNGIEGLIQMSDKFLVTDHLNHCLRTVSTSVPHQSETYAGLCQTGDDQDGRPMDARFNGPFGLLRNNNIIYITDSWNRKIKRLDLVQNLIQTVHRSHSHNFCDLVLGQQENAEEFYVTVKNGVLHILNGQETFLVGSKQSNNNKPEFTGQFSGVDFDDPLDIVWIDSKTLLVASQWDTTVKIIDIEKWEGHNICICKL